MTRADWARRADWAPAAVVLTLAVPAVDLLWADRQTALGAETLSRALYASVLAAVIAVAGALALRSWLLDRRERSLAALLQHGGGDLQSRGVELQSRYKDLVFRRARQQAHLGSITLAALALVAANVLTAKTEVLPAYVVPAPVAVFSWIEGNWRTLLTASLWSLARLGVSLAVAATLALLAGLPLGRHAGWRGILEPHTAVLSSLPPMVLAGVVGALLGPQMLAVVPWFREPGISPPFFRPALKDMAAFSWYFDEAPKLALTTWAAFWPIFAGAVGASVHCPRSLIEAGEVSGATTYAKMRHIVLPQALPQLLTNLKVGAVIGFVILLWAEAALPGNDRAGLGKWVHQYYADGFQLGVFGAIVFAAGISAVMLVGFEWIRRRLIPWSLEDERRDVLPAPSVAPAVELQTESVVRWLGMRLERSGSAERGALVVEHVTKSYGPLRALDMGDQRLEVRGDVRGKVVSIVGQSGHGKTTLVKIIAGLIPPDAGHGEVSVDGAPQWVDGKPVPASRQRAPVAYAFQDYALLPNRTLRENISFSREVARTRTRDDIGSLIDALQLAEHAHKFPSQLSGGQKQRTALGRALLQDAPVLVLDEPLANLDQPTRGEVRELIRAYAQRTGVTVLNVSHDRHDVMEMSDVVLYVRHGRIMDFGEPMALFLRPRLVEVARFLGHQNVFKGRVRRGRGYVFRAENTESLTVNDLSIDGGPAPPAEEASLDLLIPASWINVAPKTSACRRVSARIRDRKNLGLQVVLGLELEDGIRLTAILQDDDLRAVHVGESRHDFWISGCVPIAGATQRLTEISI